MNAEKLSNKPSWKRGKKPILLLFLICIAGSLFFSPSAEPDLTVPDLTVPDLTVMGYINVRDGIGKQAIDLIETFQDEFTINFVMTSKSKMENLDCDLAEFVRKSQKKECFGKVVIFEDMLWTPGRNSVKKLVEAKPHSIKIAYSMWESTQIPDEWVSILNCHFDAVCVPAPFLVEVYTSSGVEIPIFVVPLGRNFDDLAKLPLKQRVHSPFIFGNLSACSFRKNQLLLIRAFNRAFGSCTDVKLRINSRYGEVEAIDAITDYLKQHELDNVIFTKSLLTREEYLNEFLNIDCYVSPSKGEGFSIQPREAMALGIPVICSKNTGQIDICHSGLVHSIETNIPESALYPWGSYYGKQTTCSVDELAKALIEVKENHDHYLSRGEEARKWAMQFDLTQLKPLYRTLIKPQKIRLGEVNHIDGDCLVTSSHTLYDKYNKAFFADKR